MIKSNVALWEYTYADEQAARRGSNIIGSFLPVAKVTELNKRSYVLITNKCTSLLHI